MISSVRAVYNTLRQDESGKGYDLETIERASGITGPDLASVITALERSGIACQRDHCVRLVSA